MIDPPAEAVAVEPIVVNDGAIHFGNDVVLSTSSEPVKLVTKPGARIALGDHVAIGSGSTIAAFGRVEIGANTRVGARCLVLDDDSKAGIRIGEHVEIEDHVLIVAGADIGARARILAGAIVRGKVKDDEVVQRSAEPMVFQPESSASTAKSSGAATHDDTPLLHDVRVVVSSILPSAAVAEPDAELSDWDSLTTVHLIVALEERFNIMIDDGALIDRRTLSALTAYVEEQRAATTGAPVAHARRLSKPVVVASDVAAHVETPATPEAPPAEPVVARPPRRSAAIAMELRSVSGAFTKGRVFMRLANALPTWSLRHLRLFFLRSAGIHIGPKCAFLGKVRMIGPSPANLEVNEGAIIGPNVTFGVDARIVVGRSVSVSPGVTIYTATHDVGPAQRRMDLRVIAKPVTIEDGAWIGLNALILPGVTVGAGAIVSAGAVVGSDVPPNTVVAGNPAVVTRTIVA